MPVKIRLQRKGKKGRPFYHIVIADSRATRDGRFIENLGSYNPLTIPADINIDVDKAVDWLRNGAQPTDTVRAILSYSGVLYKAHLLKGVEKGALTEEQATMKFEEWKREKQEKIHSRIKQLSVEAKDSQKKRFEAEVKVKQERADEIARKRAAEMDARIAAAQANTQAATEAAAEEAVIESPEATVAEEPVIEAPAAEAAEETAE
jgi:small subunit ribosomal protein S16